jgi:hypothetical protein
MVSPLITEPSRRRGYVGTAPGLRAPVVALSLGGLRRQVEAALMPDDDVLIVLRLDRAAECERNERRSRAQVAGGRERAWPR